jgi:hypothetical protein
MLGQVETNSLSNGLAQYLPGSTVFLPAQHLLYLRCLVVLTRHLWLAAEAQQLLLLLVRQGVVGRSHPSIL